ncbi:hypothetical protein ACFL3T_00630 [Patescibacteria group bacterium]
MDRFKELADVSVQKAIKKMGDDPRFRRTDIAKPEALLAQSEALAQQGARSCRFEYFEQPLFQEAFRQAVIDALDPACTLDSYFGRFDIPLKEKDKKAQQVLKKRDKLIIECDPIFDDIHERGEELFEYLHLVGKYISKEEFQAKALALFERLKMEHPQLFDESTGQPRTPIHPVIIDTFPMTREEMIIKPSNKGKQSHIYRRELIKMIKFIRGLFKFDPSIKFADNLPEVSFRTPARTAKSKLRRKGVFLYMPLVYHGYSLDLAERHCKEKLGEDFEVCDPLTGMFAIIQNPADYLQDPQQLYKLGFHDMHGSDGNLFMQVSDTDVQLNTVSPDRGARNLTSGVIYSPKNSYKKKGSL